MRDIIIPIGGTHPPDPNNQCNLCKRIVVPSRLTRCFCCKKLFCKSCITEDLYEGKYLVCLNCARKYVSPQLFRGKYTPLTMYLSRKAKWTNWLRLKFSQIEGIIGDELPVSAQRNINWWRNKNSSHAKSWLYIGWDIQEVKLKEKTVIFTRPERSIPQKVIKSKKSTPAVKLPEYKPRKKKLPSLTRIANAQARLENISRRKSSMRKYRGKFRSKSAYEKRLWDTDEKP